MRKETEIISFSSSQPFNSEIYLVAYISKVDAEDILSDKFILYIETGEGQRLEEYSFQTFSECVRQAHMDFGDLMLRSWDQLKYQH